ncbi:two-component system KDP operon response regulator KdpE [Thermosporothrix hazakensis]|jgi:two-component system KDP operon response regulator KdpE|uniref:Transcriptional regulatory protein KdpE n=2 Tax=Thermosporothrix TaxID=768650 RepID=A0A326U8A6_THEHA|nr:response regulator transcription factor [Thermosporothrix hazakensis]PZW31966.1 two-component system KDP operon response regulator KdpE [Thermosporothrix hazakensis]BBH91563.1 DNA-binding response regulator [Thermosporothrix sp. COM3]GCE49709.1 DNA-binding response regulator [Thermosporothrix hazakensis]
MSKSGARILVVDDEIEIVRALQRSLTAHGYEVFTTGSGEEALDEIMRHRPDLVLLDLGLPGISGLEVCKRVREQSNLPIIILSVKDTERDKVLALDLGADDYVSKPFGINEVLARVRVALRHSAQVQAGTEPVFESGPLRIDFALRAVQVNGKDVKLTPTEYDLLKALVNNRGKIMTRQMLLSQVWGAGYGSEAHYLHVYIGQLRRKIEPDPAHPRFILTISGVGYRFSSEERE